ncbi:MAG: flavin reductase family protein [Labrys sp. (in: a-proteobacteria)]|jgi:flavin reductase (DIM6/NTAB) family NADH-FMN oxidoreductase RutF
MSAPAVLSPDFDSRTFRSALGAFATGVTIVSAAHPTAGLIGITANSFNSVSLDPPLVLFSIARTATSLPAFLESPGFAVNVLRDDQRALSDHFARSGPDKWARVPHLIGLNGAPILPGAIAAFDCERYATHDGGDHVIVLGRVVALEHDHAGQPLLYFRGRYRALSGTPD